MTAEQTVPKRTREVGLVRQDAVQRLQDGRLRLRLAALEEGLAKGAVGKQRPLGRGAQRVGAQLAVPAPRQAISARITLALPLFHNQTWSAY